MKIYTEDTKITHTTLDENGSKVNVFDFGSIKLNSEAKFSIKAEGESESFRVRTTCGCTIATPIQENDNLYSTVIEYNRTGSKGTFSKILFFYYVLGGKENSIKIKIKGTVI